MKVIAHVVQQAHPVAAREAGVAENGGRLPLAHAREGGVGVVGQDRQKPLGLGGLLDGERDLPVVLDDQDGLAVAPGRPATCLDAQRAEIMNGSTVHVDDWWPC